VYREDHFLPSLQSLMITEMTLGDLDDVLDIEQRSFPTPWSKDLFLKELHSKLSKIFIATSNLSGKPRVLGYISLWFIGDEVQVLNLACHPDFRRRGVASTLLEHSLSFYQKRGAKRVFLDVRRSNHEARSLYRRYGFKPIGVRKGYYADTKEDAIVMIRKMRSSPSSKDCVPGAPRERP
jgi:ribosomal-protein-alanine N-acetyltransferase